MALILGIDPGSQTTGYGVISATANRLQYVTSGCIRLRDSDHGQRLKQLFRELSALIVEFQPVECAIEEVFVGKNVASALKLGQARGCAMVACLHQDMSVHEYSARKVKQALTGSGAADKTQVQHMVKILLGVSGVLQQDAGDALAIAICHANTRDSLARMQQTGGFRGGRLQGPGR